MKTSPQQFAVALHQALSEARPADADRVLDNFVQALADAGQLGQVEEIFSEFLKYDLKQRGRVPACATFAKAAPHNRKILDDLNAVLGGNVEFKKKLDGKLLGGVVIETEDERIDLSVKKQLDNLKKTLSE